MSRVLLVRTWMVYLIFALVTQMAAPYCDKDTTDAMAALVEKFQGLGERIDTAVQARQTSIKEQVDEVKEEIAVLQEEREKYVITSCTVLRSLT